MKILFLADLHWGAYNIPARARRIRPYLNREEVAAVVICGDICHPPDARSVLSRIRENIGSVPVAICLGNHDFWVGERQASAYDFDEVIEKFWIPACKAAGFVLLDRGNLALEGFTIVGGYGHYDFGHAVPGLKIKDRAVTLEDYRAGGIPGVIGVWNDMVYMAARRSTEEEAEIQTRRIAGRLDEAIRTGGRIVMAVHTVPFAGLNGHPRDFFGAFGGNAVLGKELSDRAASIELLVCGHTHRVVEPALFEGIRCLNVGNDYGELYGVVYNTETRHLQWVDFIRDELFPTQFNP